MTNPFNLNKFNSFLNAAAQTIACGPECQRSKREEELKNNYLKAESNVYLAEPQYENAKKEYYTYVGGTQGYNDVIQPEYEKQAADYVANFKSKYDTDVNKIKSLLETYNGIFINFRNVIDLYEQYKVENINLFKQLKDDTNDLLTNERKTYYEDQEIDSLNKYYNYLLWIIYIIVVICYVLFSLFYPTTFSLLRRMIILIAFIILPFISTWLLGKFIQFLYWLFSFVPKNVYKETS